jgi:hypothetical protein
MKLNLVTFPQKLHYTTINGKELQNEENHDRGTAMDGSGRDGFPAKRGRF